MSSRFYVLQLLFLGFLLNGDTIADGLDTSLKVSVKRLQTGIPSQFNSRLPSFASAVAIRSRLHSKMPKFSEDEQAELDRIMAGEQIDFSSNLPVRKKKTSSDNRNPSDATLQENSSVTKPSRVMKPNSEWRTALSNPTSPSSVKKRKQTPSTRFDDMFSDKDDPMDFDYDDLFEAMREIETSGESRLIMGNSAKRSAIPVERPGLDIGDVVQQSWWEKCSNSAGERVSLAKLLDPVKPSQSTAATATAAISPAPTMPAKSVEYIVFFADPRIITSDFREVIDQFNQLPRKKLRISTVLINCDDPNDLRKLSKKIKVNSHLLAADTERVFMKSLQCQAPDCLQHMLGIINAKSGQLLRVWYENDWPTITTKDLITRALDDIRGK